jgi:hypothetical protein
MCIVKIRRNAKKIIIHWQTLCLSSKIGMIEELSAVESAIRVKDHHFAEEVELYLIH